jgi:hypothetical protein
MNHPQRVILSGVMDWLVAESRHVHYQERRPMFTWPLDSLAELRQALATPAGITMDCSESCTLIYRVCGLATPWAHDGVGFTGTMLRTLTHYHDARRANIGALVVFGPGDGEHVCMVRKPGANPILFSHGSEAGPIYVRLSVEAAAHTPPVTLLDVSHL